MSTLSAFLYLTLPINTQALPDDRQQAIEVFSDSASYTEQDGKAVYIGNVVMTQGSLKLQADYVELEQQSSNIHATGKPAKFEQQPTIDKPVITATANSILYKQQEGYIELTGSAHVTQGEANIKSERIVYNLNTQSLNASNTKNTEGQSGRVHVIIPPTPNTSDQNE